MEFFALDGEVAGLEAELAAPAGPAEAAAGRLETLLALAWHSRQRGTRRALALADEAQALLDGSDGAALPPSTRHRAQARLLLVRGEARWLFSELEAAHALADAALRAFEALADGEGQADAHWLRAWLASSQGDRTRRDAELAAMEALVQGDPVRHGVVEAFRALTTAHSDLAAATRRWGARFAAGATGLHPAVGCQAEFFLSICGYQSGDLAAAFRHALKAHTLALESGQIRCAIMAATNAGEYLCGLNDYDTALEWMRRGLELARACGWPGPLGSVLRQTALPLRRLQRNDAARGMLREALALLAPQAASHHYALTLNFLGDTELDCGEHAAALSTFQALAQRAAALEQPQLKFRALRGQSAALLHLGQPQQALEAAGAALTLSQDNAEQQIAALRVLAEIHAVHPQASPPHANPPNANPPQASPPSMAPPGMDAAEVPLHFLQRALAVSEAMDGHTVPPDLLEALAEASDRVGQPTQAYRFALRAISARGQTHSREAMNRASAMQATHETERARAEAEHLRQLAQSEARRAEALQRTSDTLERLGAVGQEITSCLDGAEVVDLLQRHVGHLLDAGHFAVYMLEPDGQKLRCIHGLDEGRGIKGLAIPMSHQTSHAVRCARERRELLVDHDPALPNPAQIPGLRLSLSALFSPLQLGGRVLGVITVQSRRRHAYGEWERMVFRSLSAYAAIALSNAQAHERLRDGMQEKLASLNTLTAGVAHEINNPTNFAHVAAQNQRVHINEFRRFVAELVEDGDGREDLLNAFGRRFDVLEQGVGVFLNGTERIRRIVKDLNAYTRQEKLPSERARVSECVQSTLALVRSGWGDGIEFAAELEPDPEIECWPSLLNQVFMNLAVNGCHAIAARHGENTGGRLLARLVVGDGTLSVSMADNGTGMPEAVRARVLEPFFTTKKRGEGTGLGLAIVHGIVQRHGGELRIESVEGEGTCVTLVLPLVPPPTADGLAARQNPA